MSGTGLLLRGESADSRILFLSQLRPHPRDSARMPCELQMIEPSWDTR